MDRGAWRAMIYRAAKSQTRLKQLSTETGLSNNIVIFFFWPVGAEVNEDNLKFFK